MVSRLKAMLLYIDGLKEQYYIVYTTEEMKDIIRCAGIDLHFYSDFIITSILNVSIAIILRGLLHCSFTYRVR